MSCEEYGRGQCWQVDPQRGGAAPAVTALGGEAGGNYESVAVDDRDPSRPTFFVTEDHESGALRRYTPPPPPIQDGGNATRGGAPPAAADWRALHAEGGQTKYLVFLKDDEGRLTNEFAWVRNEDRGRRNAREHFPNAEGIDFDDGRLYFVSKRMMMLYVLDVESRTYRTLSTAGGLPVGEFLHSPDQIVRNNGGDFLYFTEDGGDTAGVYAIDASSPSPPRRYAIFEASDGRYKHDETTGLAFSPDGRRMYAAFQDCGCEGSETGVDATCGCLLEFVRDDGRSFDGKARGLKFHSDK